MPRSIRPAFAGIIFLAACTSLLIAWSPADVGVSVQAPRSAVAAPPITPEQAAPFIGDWAVTVNMNTFEATFAVAVKADGGKVTATVSSAGQPTVNVTDISLAGKNLVLKYFSDTQGTAKLDRHDAHARRPGAARQLGGDGRPVPDVWHRHEAGAGRAGALRWIRRRTRRRDQRADRFHAEAALSRADARRGGSRLHAAGRLSPRARRRRPRRHQPDDHRVRRQRPHVCRRDDQLHDGRRGQPRARADQPHQPLGEHRRATAATTSARSSPITSSPRA